MSKKPGATQALHKVIMVGSGGVGKSALTLQFMYDEVCRRNIKFLINNQTWFNILLLHNINCLIRKNFLRLSHSKKSHSFKNQSALIIFLSLYIKKLHLIKFGFFSLWKTTSRQKQTLTGRQLY